MSLTRTDVFVAGGGLAGLVAAVTFGRAGYGVVLADPSPPPEEGSAGADRRSTAILTPGQAFLDRIGLWTALAPRAIPLTGLRIVDTEGWPPELRESRLFEPRDLGADTFGWNLPNAAARQAMLQAAEAMGNVTLLWGVGVAGILTRTGEAHVTLTGGRRIAARLAIAADGRASALREAAGIAVTTRRYGQRALAFTATHDAPHGGISTEIYNRGGAFTTVPLEDQGGRPASAIVWMHDGAEVEALARLDAAEFDAEMTRRAAGQLGGMRRDSPLATWPILTQTATRLTAERVVLVAEAAHVLPPIGAQGYNSSLQDIATLADLAETAPERLGTPEHLRAYALARGPDTALRAQAIDLYNRLCRSGAPPLQALRRTGLRLVHDAPALRRAAMRMGLGGS